MGVELAELIGGSLLGAGEPVVGLWDDDGDDDDDDGGGDGDVDEDEGGGGKWCMRTCFPDSSEVPGQNEGKQNACVGSIWIHNSKYHI